MIISMSLAQLVGILHIICRGRGLNPGHPTSPQFNCVSSSLVATWPKKKRKKRYMILEWILIFYLYPSFKLFNLKFYLL